LIIVYVDKVFLYKKLKKQSFAQSNKKLHM